MRAGGRRGAGGTAGGEAEHAASCYTSQASCSIHLKQYDQALAASDQAIEVDKTYWRGWRNRGDALGWLVRWDEAADSYQQSRNRSPPSEEVAEICESLKFAKQQAVVLGLTKKQSSPAARRGRRSARRWRSACDGRARSRSCRERRAGTRCGSKRLRRSTGRRAMTRGPVQPQAVGRGGGQLPAGARPQSAEQAENLRESLKIAQVH